MHLPDRRPTRSPTAPRDLLAATSALAYLREVRTPDAPRGLAARRPDPAGWSPSWSRARTTTAAGPGSPPRPAGQRPAERPADLGARGLRPRRGPSRRAPGRPRGPRQGGRPTWPREFSRADAATTRPAPRSSTPSPRCGKASFEQANSLNRVRQNLPDVGPGLPRPDLRRPRPREPGRRGPRRPRARGRSPSRPAPGKKPRTYWEGKDQGPYHRGAVETTALAALAFARVRPQAPELAGGRRLAPGPPAGDGWQPAQGQGRRRSPPWPRSTARPSSAEDRYAWSSPSTTPRSTGPTSPARPRGRRSSSPGRRSRWATANRVRFHIEGRGTFGYAVDPDRLRPRLRPRAGARRQAVRRSTAGPTSPADPELDGKAAADRVSASAVNPTTVHQPGHPGRPRRPGPGRDRRPAGTTAPTGPTWERDFLVVEETLPAGTTLIEGSVRPRASSLHPGRRRPDLLLRPRAPARARSSYDVFGYLPGQYRALPTRIRGGLRPRPVAPRPGRRRSGSSPPASRRPTPTRPRPTSSTPGARPSSRPAGSPRPPSRSRSSSAATPSATTSPRTPRGCS